MQTPNLPGRLPGHHINPWGTSNSFRSNPETPLNLYPYLYLYLNLYLYSPLKEPQGLPLRASTWTSALARTSILTTSSWPARDAPMSGVRPKQFFLPRSARASDRGWEALFWRDLQGPIDALLQVACLCIDVGMMMSTYMCIYIYCV